MTSQNTPPPAIIRDLGDLLDEMIAELKNTSIPLDGPMTPLAKRWVDCWLAKSKHRILQIALEHSHDAKFVMRISAKQLNKMIDELQ